MTLALVIDPEAESDYEEAYNFYESRQFGLGEDFGDAVEAVFNRITKSPKFYGLVHKTTRRGLVIGFPFCVYYQVESIRIRVISVFHTSRDPSIWQSRV